MMQIVFFVAIVLEQGPRGPFPFSRGFVAYEKVPEGGTPTGIAIQETHGARTTGRVSGGFVSSRDCNSGDPRCPDDGADI